MNGRLFMEAMGDIKDEFIMEASDIDEIKRCFAEWDDEEEENKPTPQKTTENKKRISKPLRILVAAVIVLSLLFATCVASAEFFDFNIAEELVEYFGDYLKIKMDVDSQKADSYSLTGTALAKELEANGISPVTLPAALLADEWIIEKITYQKDEFFSSSDILLTNSDTIALINIVQYTQEDFLTEIKVSYPNKGTKMEINGMDVFAFQLKETANAIYRDELTDYSISIGCDYDSFVKIIKTIK